jgi:hypothetical protein
VLGDKGRLVEFVGVGFVELPAFGQFLVEDFFDPVCGSHCGLVACGSQLIFLGFFTLFQSLIAIWLLILKTLLCQIGLIEISIILKIWLLQRRLLRQFSGLSLGGR